MTPYERVMAKTQRGADTDACWVVEKVGPQGYGQVLNTVAHRVTLSEWLGRPIRDGLHVDHLCRNRACVNPIHLEEVTPRENCRRGDTGKHNRVKTHCPKGHPYDERSFRPPRNGTQHRRCLVCANEYNARVRARARMEN